jgi:hypothetical protein
MFLPSNLGNKTCRTRKQTRENPFLTSLPHKKILPERSGEGSEEQENRPKKDTRQEKSEKF